MHAKFGFNKNKKDVRKINTKRLSTAQAPINCSASLLSDCTQLVIETRRFCLNNLLNGWTVLFARVSKRHNNQWCNWRGAEGRIAAPSKLNVKNGPPLSLYFSFCILLVFSRLLLFFAFFGVFSSVLVFYSTIATHIRIHHHLSGLFLSVGKWAPYSGQWPFSAKFLPPGSNLQLRHC